MKLFIYSLSWDPHWNSLPNDIKEIENFAHFKRKVNEYRYLTLESQIREANDMLYDWNCYSSASSYFFIFYILTFLYLRYRNSTYSSLFCSSSSSSSFSSTCTYYHFYHQFNVVILIMIIIIFNKFFSCLSVNITILTYLLCTCISGTPLEISSWAFVGYPVQADLILICYSCILYVGSLANKNQSINQSVRKSICINRQ